MAMHRWKKILKWVLNPFRAKASGKSLSFLITTINFFLLIFYCPYYSIFTSLPFNPLLLCLLFPFLSSSSSLLFALLSSSSPIPSSHQPFLFLLLSCPSPFLLLLLIHHCFLFLLLPFFFSSYSSFSNSLPFASPQCLDLCNCVLSV